MTDPTPTTPQAPPHGLTDEQLLELADGLIAAIRAVIAAHEAARVGLHCYLDDNGEPCPSPCVFDDPAEQISDCTYAQKLQRDGEAKTSCPHYRTETAIAARPHLTPEEVEARFRAWWGECYPNVPAGRHTVRSHVAFAMHLLGGEGAA